MTPPVTAPARPDSLSQTLATQVAALLPTRVGVPWTVELGSAWWTTKPAARLTQNTRSLVLVWNPWHTDLAWELPDRVPYRPDLRSERLAPARVARDVLRLVLPVLDDEAARSRPNDDAGARLAVLAEIGAAMRAQGAATYERGGLLVNTSTVTWSSSGCRYSATLHGSNPVADVQVEGPVRAVERAVVHFLPEAGEGRPRVPDGIRGRLQRRMAAVLARHGHVEQTERGGLAFGTGPGPYGYAAPAFDPQSRAHDTTPASVDLHGVGVDFLISLAPYLAR
ncbi:hypothetical protein [Streptomyces sp. CL12-4]|uniref:hypothetical protein n=1 Tax=Streptomyces sp. CL12-4 TaxID=2810306 RepID=UPI001EFA7E99|nr:hypothetical protein [Streptomyces sp. CL12-4]MCG8971821.1 hypothetical protein [Streptomyces sp. CL12-4]